MPSSIFFSDWLSTVTFAPIACASLTPTWPRPVSHALGTIQELADHAIWMDHGEMRMWDDPETVVNAYTEFLEVEQNAVTLEDV